MTLYFLSKYKTYYFFLSIQSQNASPKQRKQSVYTPPAMKGTVHVLFPVVVSAEFMDGRQAVLRCLIPAYKLDLSYWKSHYWLSVTYVIWNLVSSRVK